MDVYLMEYRLKTINYIHNDMKGHQIEAAVNK